MGVLSGLLLILFNLICIGLDITIFFLLCRIILTWRSINWIEQMNDVGQSLVNAVTIYVCRLWYKKSQKQLPENIGLIFSFAVLLIARIILCKIARIF